MLKQLWNSVIAKYRHLSMSRRSIICLGLRLRQITDLLAAEKSRYFAQPRAIIVDDFRWNSTTITIQLGPIQIILNIVW